MCDHTNIHTQYKELLMRNERSLTASHKIKHSISTPYPSQHQTVRHIMHNCHQAIFQSDNSGIQMNAITYMDTISG
jgi:hypothetical protein